MKTKSKIPALRFKGFTDAWEQRKLGEIANMHARIGWQNLRTSEFLDSGEYMLITGTDFQDGKIDYSKVHYVEKERYEQDKKIQISNGSILITKDGTIGKVAYVENLPMKSTLNAGVFNLTVVDDINTSNLYLYHYLKGPFLLRFVNEESTGGTIKHLNQNVLVKFPIPLPSYREQLKISAFLTNIDKLITLHQRKCEQTKELKKTMLQKMFPKKGERIPEIRFPEFTDEWEEKKLGEVGETFTGLSGKTKADFGHGAGKFVTYVNVFNNPISDLKGVDSIEIDDNQKQVQYGDILITTSSETPEEVGMTSVWLGREENVYLNSFCFGFRPTTELSSYYMAYALRSHEVRKKFIILAQGISRYNISKTKVMEINIPFPSLPEQEAIGAYFQTLDQDIAQIEKKLADLKELKKTLLRQLFV